MGNAKHDEESWSLLTKGDLQGQAGNLLCRMSYYDEKLTRNLNLPMLDKYFLINSGGALSVDIRETVDRISREMSAYTPSFGTETNDRAAAAYARSTGQDTRLTTSDRASTTARTPTTTTTRATTTSATSAGTRRRDRGTY